MIRTPEKERLLLDVGERIYDARNRRGLSQKVLAARAGLSSSSQLSQFENSQKLPRIETLYRIAAALRCPVHDLLPKYDEGDSP